MMVELFSRHVNIESVVNFRDLGGYVTRDGREVAWRRLFRSGEFSHITREDLNRLTKEVGLTSVIDLRTSREAERQGMGLLAETSIRYHNIPFLSGSSGSKIENENLLATFTNMGEFYLHLVRQKGFGERIVDALKIIAEPENHPLIFHCAIGKDRTGILSAVLLSVLGVEDTTIVEDYSLSGPAMKKLIERLNQEPETAEFVQSLPGYFWEATPESMALFLATLEREYGSVGGYLEAQGAEPSLIQGLKTALLI